jgi:nitrite reductase/ring-hydroxylating ferredoxin subunit
MWTTVCRLADVGPGEMTRVEVEGYPALAVYNVGGEIYVSDDRCTHVEAALTEGWLEGDVIECPFHGGRFHVPTGRPLCKPVKKPLTTYEVRVADGQVLIR